MRPLWLLVADPQAGASAELAYWAQVADQI
jgi:hypothetical protein